MNIVFIKEYLTYKIGQELKKVNKQTFERLLDLGVIEEVKEKKTRKKKSTESVS